MSVPKLRARRKKAADLNSAETHLTQPPVDLLNFITKPRSRWTEPTSYSTNVTGPHCEIQTRALTCLWVGFETCRTSLDTIDLMSHAEIGEEEKYTACIDQERVCGVILTSNNTSCEVVLAYWYVWKIK